MEDLTKLTVAEFSASLFSKRAVPGGGAAAGLSAALGTALAGMVANLTAGKKKYAAYETELQNILNRAQELLDAFLSLINEDAENFLPLARAYSLPASTQAEKAYKKDVLEQETLRALQAPIQSIRLCAEAIVLQEILFEKGSALALSDVGVGAELLRAALLSAWMNVLINTGALSDRTRAKSINTELEPVVRENAARAEALSVRVQKALSSGKD